MGKMILENIDDDKDTIIVNTDEEYDTAEEDITGDSLPNPKLANKGLYALLEVIAVVAGTITALISAIAFGVAYLEDTSGWTAEEIKKVVDEYSALSPLAEFAGKHVQANFVSKYLTIAVSIGLIAIAAVIGLSVMTGRFKRDEENRIQLNWFDRLWSEIHIAAVCAAATGAVFSAYPVWYMVRATDNIGPFDLSGVYTLAEKNNYLYEISNNTVFWYCAAGIAICLSITVVSFVTLVKKLKAKVIIKASLLGKILALLGIGAAYAGRGAAKAGKGIARAGHSISERNKSRVRSFTIPDDNDRRAAYKLMLKYSLAAVALIGLPFVFLIFTGEYGACFFLTVICCVAAIAIICRKVGKLAEIRAGVIEVKSGNLDHKITVREDEKGPKTDLDKLASDINNISEATSAAVQNEIKNQRLKTDLISNVSHDLRTPLTSMITYLDILEQEGLDSPDAEAHLDIVREKTERLKELTDELFEAAKASSGNIPCEITDIDIAALIDQSLAEMESRLAAKDLIIKKKITAKNTTVQADGKLMYRVFENLLSNISKYALTGSRVYIDVSECMDRSGRLLIEFKNISESELNISADELMERFTRGDQSRNTEGSGLGLAIAKDLTTLMGGSFDISIDGDMFKATVRI